jgi:hypothetical protein
LAICSSGLGLRKFTMQKWSQPCAALPRVSYCPVACRREARAGRLSGRSGRPCPVCADGLSRAVPGARDTVMGVAGRTYAENRPYLLPETLRELAGPLTGVVLLPLRLDW